MMLTRKIRRASNSQLIMCIYIGHYDYLATELRDLLKVQISG